MGSKPTFGERKNAYRRNKRDVGERGMDEDVHGFVYEAIPPLNTRERSTMPFIPNGSAIGDWDENAFYSRKRNSNYNNE